MDADGSGKATMTFAQIEELLQVSRTTIWRYYSSDLFTRVIRRGEVLTLYYRGIVPVCLDYGIKHWGTSCEVNLEDLADLKTIATLADTLSLQSKSRFIATKKRRSDICAELGRKRAPKGSFVPAISDSKIDALFNDSSQDMSEISPGIKKREHGTVFVGDAWTPFGASQATIANHLGKSYRTVSRRLKSAPKLKVAYSSGQTAHEFNFYKFQDEENWTTISNRFFIKDGIVYKRMCSLYRPILSLTTKRRRLRVLSSAWERVSAQKEALVV